MSQEVNSEKAKHDASDPNLKTTHAPNAASKVLIRSSTRFFPLSFLA